jgi:hypothetical protein
LAVVSALVLAVGLLLQSSYYDRLNDDLPFALLYLVPIACLTLITGTVLLLSRSGFRGVAGFLVGIAVTSPWGLAVLIAASVQGHVNDSYPGLWTMLTGLALLLAAGCVAAVSAHRAGVARTAWQRPDRWTATTLVIAVGGAAWLFSWSLYLPAELAFAFGVVTAALAIVVPIWVMCLHPRQFALAVAIGWTAGGLFIGLSLWEAAIELGVTWIGPLGFVPALLAVVAFTAVDRGPSDQPLTR